MNILRLLTLVKIMIPPLLLMFNLSALAQSASERAGAGSTQPLMVGTSVPDGFWVKKHLFYVDGKIISKTLEEYKGKLIILDFWATWCGQCWTQMPLNEQLANTYNGDVIVLLVDTKSTKDTFDKIAATDRKYLKGMGVNRLETIFNDDYFEMLFPVRGYPKYMWISPSGYFIAATTRNSVTKGHIDGLLDIYKVK